jgi:hypothetical protein
MVLRQSELKNCFFFYFYTAITPIRVAARSKAGTVFTRPNTGVVGSNLTRGMDVCVHLFCLCCCVCRYGPCDGLIPRPRTEKAAKAQQRVAEP